jgi:hypothetical protein
VVRTPKNGDKHSTPKTMRWHKASLSRDSPSSREPTADTTLCTLAPRAGPLTRAYSTCLTRFRPTKMGVTPLRKSTSVTPLIENLEWELTQMRGVLSGTRIGIRSKGLNARIIGPTTPSISQVCRPSWQTLPQETARSTETCCSSWQSKS